MSPKTQSLETNDLTALLASLATKIGIGTMRIGPDAEAAYRWLRGEILATVLFFATRSGFAQLAEDAFHEVLIQAILASDKYEPGAVGHKGYFRNLAKLKMLTWVAREKQLIKRSSAMLGALASRPSTSDRADERLVLLEGAIQQLSASDQLLVRLMLQDLSTAEIATSLGSTREAVRQRRARLSRTLRELLNPQAVFGSGADKHGGEPFATAAI